MSKLLANVLIFFTWSIAIIILYYTQNTSHISSTLGWLIHANIGVYYFLYILLAFGIYKFFTIHDQKNISWNFWNIIIGFFLVLFIGCITYSIHVPEWLNVLILFFHILQYLLYPIILVFLWRWIGAHLAKISPTWKQAPLQLTIPIETAIGMGIFGICIFLLWYFWLFSKENILIFIAIFAIFWNHKNTYHLIKNTKITFENTHFWSLKVLTAEITFLVFCIIASTSFLSVLRPMPIGWDDMGVYMNFPKIIATTQSLLDGAGLYFWQLIMATGFSVQWATQALFVNQIGGILATIAIISSISLFLKIHTKKHTENTHKNIKYIEFLCLPMILGIVYYLMPMTVFQQAKDMKLDPMLMFVSITAVMSLFWGWYTYLKTSKWENYDWDINHNTFFSSWIFWIAISGILTGLAFSIKITTLMLIISAIGFLSYIFLGFFWFLGFFFVFIAIFTIWNLWSFLFVWMPENSLPIGIFFTFLSIITYLLVKIPNNKKEIITQYIKAIFIFCISTSIFTLPWITKNTIETVKNHKNLSISNLLNGENSNTIKPLSSIYSKEELQKREKSLQKSNTTEDGQTLNEDFSRYFWQEKGINNYIKLPFNLTLQKNQSKEFTDITFIFLAFLPASLLFLYSRSDKKWRLFIWSFLLLWILFSLPVISSHFEFLTDILSKITLKNWAYIFLLLLVFWFLYGADRLLKNNTPEEKILIAIIFFTGIYGYIFWISAFGIVWYGIIIYFLFLIIISAGLTTINRSNQEEIFTEIGAHKQIGSIGFLILIWVYIFGSSLAHAGNTLAEASFNQYKYKQSGENSTIFETRLSYFQSLLTLNHKNPEDLTKEFRNIFENQELPKFPELQNFWNTLNEKEKTLEAIFQTLLFINQTEILKNEETKKLLETISTRILYPKPEEQNNTPIYRVGTFFTYFIHNNRSRYFEDSLLFQYNTYFANKNADTSIEKMKTLWIRYLLIDLNAATIDKDPRKNLTHRYEQLLSATTSKKLKLIASDSICLNFAIDEYHRRNITNMDDFLKTAGVNFESKNTPRWEKLLHCGNKILETFQKNDISDRPYFKAIPPKDQNGNWLLPYIQNSYFALFEIL